MAISLSVTVSIGLATKGMLREWFTVTWVESCTWLGSPWVHPGRRIRSLKVTATSVSLNLDLNPGPDTYFPNLPEFQRKPPISLIIHTDVDGEFVFRERFKDS